MSRLLRVGAAAALALGLGACAGTAPPAADPSTASSPPAPSSAAARASSSSAAAAPGAATLIEIGYADGQVSGGGRIPVDLGTTVTLQVTSDVADEVHVHGYDLMADVTSEQPARISFDATVPGVFEVELEHLGQELLTLQVQ